jgi:hypothetical protein
MEVNKFTVPNENELKSEIARLEAIINVQDETIHRNNEKKEAYQKVIKEKHNSTLERVRNAFNLSIPLKGEIEVNYVSFWGNEYDNIRVGYTEKDSDGLVLKIVSFIELKEKTMYVSDTRMEKASPIRWSKWVRSIEVITDILTGLDSPNFWKDVNDFPSEPELEPVKNLWVERSNLDFYEEELRKVQLSKTLANGDKIKYEGDKKTYYLTVTNLTEMNIIGKDKYGAKVSRPLDYSKIFLVEDALPQYKFVIDYVSTSNPVLHKLDCTHFSTNSGDYKLYVTLEEAEEYLEDNGYNPEKRKCIYCLK